MILSRAGVEKCSKDFHHIIVEQNLTGSCSRSPITKSFLGICGSILTNQCSTALKLLYAAPVGIKLDSDFSNAYIVLYADQ